VSGNRLRALANKVHGRILRPKRRKVLGGWRKIHSEEHYNGRGVK
jgi:hypothetical protein